MKSLAVAIGCIVLVLAVNITLQAQTVPVSPQQKGNLEGIDDWMMRVMKDFKVPGAVVVVVQGDKIVLLKGYGFRDTAKQLPFTPQTLFAIGSVTKSFTVTTLGMLVENYRTTPSRQLRRRFKIFFDSAGEPRALSRGGPGWCRGSLGGTPARH